MFKYKSVSQQTVEERRKNEQLQAHSLKQRSDIDYIAMMNDVELETTEEVQKNE